MKIFKRIVIAVGIIFAVISIVLNIQALIEKECNPFGNISLAIALILFAVDSFITHEMKKKE